MGLWESWRGGSYRYIGFNRIIFMYYIFKLKKKQFCFYFVNFIIFLDLYYWKIDFNFFLEFIDFKNMMKI